MEPSLTLSMPDDTTTVTATASGGGGGHSVSSLSVGVKRERLEEAADLGEMVSSTAAAGAEDDDDGSTRKKLRLTKEQSALLEDRFKEHSTLNPVRTYGTHAYYSRLIRFHRLTAESQIAALT
jgi:homeobox-leucine zipper protein